MNAERKQAADVLFNVATILELSGDNPYRIRAYRRAARSLLTDDKPDTRGLGQSMRLRIGNMAPPVVEGPRR